MTRWMFLPLLLLAGCSGSGDDAATDAAPPVALIALGRVEVGTVAGTVKLYGAAEPGREGVTALSAPVEANLARIVAPVGSHVGRGQVVAVLSATPTTRTDLAKASADARAADAALARARRLRSDGLVSDAEVETARAAAQAADAAHAGLMQGSGGLTLRAPIDGIVETMANTVGERVQPGAAVATIARMTARRARFGIDPIAARTLHPGSWVRIAATSGRGALTLPVASIDANVDPQTRLALLFVNLPAQAGFATGETLTAAVSLDGAGSGLTVPYAALLDDGGQPYVFVVERGVAHRHDVTTANGSGGSDGDRVAILRGVSAGQDVVIAGGTAIEDGMKVRTK